MPEFVSVPRLTRSAVLIHRVGGQRFTRQSPCDWEDGGGGERLRSIVGEGESDARTLERVYTFREDPDFSPATSIMDPEDGREWRVLTFQRLGRRRFIEAQAERVVLDTELEGEFGEPEAAPADAPPLRADLAQESFRGRVTEGAPDLGLPGHGPLGFGRVVFKGNEAERVLLTIEGAQFAAAGWVGGETIPEGWPVGVEFVETGDVVFLATSSAATYQPGRALSLWLATGLGDGAEPDEWEYPTGPGRVLIYDGLAYAGSA